MAFEIRPRQHSVKFQARLWFCDGWVDSMEVWVNELEPIDGKSRPSAEWVREHLHETTDILERIGHKDSTDNWQVLIEGTLSGWMSSNQDGEEWDEDLTIDKHEEMQLPADYFDEDPKEQSHWLTLDARDSTGD